MAKAASKQTSELEWPERGHFGWQPIVGPHRVTAAEMLDRRGFFGLGLESTFLYGCMRDEDGEMYEICRRMPPNASDGGLDNFFIMTTRGNECLKLDLETMADNAPSCERVERLEGDTAVWESNDSVKHKRFRISFSPASCTWTEEGTFDLRGAYLSPGLQWYLPGRDDAIFYVSNIFLMEGTLLGRSVRGMIGFDQCYMHEGGMLYQKRDPLTGHNLHRCWYTWGTRYTDGTWETGHFTVGHERHGFAIVANSEGETITTSRVEAEIHVGEDGNFPTGIALDVEGEAWEFLPDPRGPMPELMGKTQPTTPQNEGRWQRVGEKREPDVYFAWGEIAPGHGLERVQRHRF